MASGRWDLERINKNEFALEVTDFADVEHTVLAHGGIVDELRAGGRDLGFSVVLSATLRALSIPM